MVVGGVDELINIYEPPNTSHTPCSHPCTHAPTNAPTHARPSLPVNPNPNPTPAEDAISEQHDTAAAVLFTTASLEKTN